MAKLQKPFKNETNQRYSKQLFWESWRCLPIEDRIGDEPPFTLHLKKDGFVCFGKEYINDCDPTGYKTSTRLLGDYSYWKHLEKSPWFREALVLWNEEMDAKLKAEAFDKIRELAEGEDAKALAAAKFIALQEYKKTDGNKRGRPSKAEVQGRLNQVAEDEQALREDAERIRLVK